MPADVAVRPPPLAALPLAPSPGPDPAPACAWSPSEERCGHLDLLDPVQRAPVPVLVRVYRTSLEHFAVLYPAHYPAPQRPLGVLNLRHTRVQVQAEGRGFEVRQRAPDAPHAVAFRLPPGDGDGDGREVAAWVAAFTWRGSPALHASPLPALLEDDEA